MRQFITTYGWELYFLCALLSVLYLGLVKKIDPDGDWITVTFLWFLLWPMALISRLIRKVISLSKKIKIFFYVKQNKS